MSLQSEQNAVISTPAVLYLDCDVKFADRLTENYRNKLEILHTPTIEEFLSCLKEGTCQLALCRWCDFCKSEDLINAVKGNLSEIPFIFIASDEMAEDVRRAFLLGAGDFLTERDVLSEDSLWDAVSRTITKTRNEFELRESEKRYRFLFNESQSVNILLDPEGRIIEVNEACCRFSGYSQSQLVGVSAFEFVESGEREKAMGVFQQDILGEKTSSLTLSIRKKCGGIGKLLLGEGRAILRDDRDRPIGLLVSAVDVTEWFRVEQELEKSRRKLRELSAHLIDVRENERTRIAREIHDELGQFLTVLKIEMDLSGRRFGDSGCEICGKSGRLVKMIDDSLQFVHRIVTELRPSVLDDLGLSAAIRWQASEFFRHTGIRCIVEDTSDDTHFSLDLSTSIFRILQEALTNAARHSGATEVKIHLSSDSESIKFSIEDNGSGISPEQLSKAGSFGILGIRERVYMLGGEFDIKGAPMSGTILGFIFPMPEKENRHEKYPDS